MTGIKGFDEKTVLSNSAWLIYAANHILVIWRNSENTAKIVSRSWLVAKRLVIEILVVTRVCSSWISADFLPVNVL